MENELYEKWLKFHKNNPNIYHLFDKYTQQVIKVGKKCGAKAVWEQIRWQTLYRIKDPFRNKNEDFDLNNNHTAYYARHWMKQNPKHKDFFELRCVKGEQKDLL